LADEAMSRSLGPGVEWLYIQCFCCGVCDVQKMTWVTSLLLLDKLFHALHVGSCSSLRLKREAY
jgi:hypothetical protein